MDRKRGEEVLREEGAGGALEIVDVFHGHGLAGLAGQGGADDITAVDTADIGEGGR